MPSHPLPPTPTLANQGLNIPNQNFRKLTIKTPKYKIIKKSKIISNKTPANEINSYPATTQNTCKPLIYKDFSPDKIYLKNNIKSKIIQTPKF